MIDLVLFAGRVLLVILLYVFLFAVMRTGIGLVRGQRKDGAIWYVDVEKGIRSLRGLHADILGPVVIGRSPSSLSMSRMFLLHMHVLRCRVPLSFLKISGPPTAQW